MLRKSKALFILLAVALITVLIGCKTLKLSL